MNGHKADKLIGLKAQTSKEQMMAKMADIPADATHVGVANTDIGLTVIVASAIGSPRVWNPEAKQWVELLTKSDLGLLKPAGTS